MDVSILIATFNRCEALEATLARLADLEVPAGARCEVIVVDNNSTDRTAAVIADVARRRPDRFRGVFEGTQGKSAALNAGLARATGDIIVFTDDDCLADRGWVAAILRAFSDDPSLAVIGGRVELYRDDDLPVTIRTSRVTTPFTSLDQLFSLIAGCNMAFRRSALDEAGAFDTRFGPGRPIGAAEDVDLLYRVFRRGSKIVYAPEPVVFHNHGRKSETDLSRLNRQYIIGRGAFYAKYILRGDRAVLKLAYWEARNTCRSLARDALIRRPVREEWRRLAWLARGIAYGLVAIDLRARAARAS